MFIDLSEGYSAHFTITLSGVVMVIVNTFLKG